MRILIVGGGPAGMAAALAAAEAGAQVTLLERRPKPGKKLLATGNGRCNLAHRGEPVYFGDAAFAGKVFIVCPPESVMAQLDSWGLPLYTDPEGRVYPATQQASSVLSLLTARMAERGVRLVTDADVAAVSGEDGRWTARTADGRAFSAERLILATGGLAGGGLGNRPQDYALAEGLGHHLMPTFGGLAPLEAELVKLRRLSGLRLPARVRLLCDGKRVAASSGEVLFTDYGVSGICVMQLARDAQACLERGRLPELELDFSPVYFPEERAYAREAEPAADAYGRTAELLFERERRFGRAAMLTGLVPDALTALCPVKDVRETAAFLTGLRLRITGVRPMQYAQITCGGIDTAEIEPATMASRLRSGLHFAGEVVNVDGDCGGYNLQFAFATGLIAGRSAAE